MTSCLHGGFPRGVMDSACVSPDRVLIRVYREEEAQGATALPFCSAPAPPTRWPAPGHGALPMGVQVYLNGL